MGRKTRSDKGTPKITIRDIEVVRWIVEMDEVSNPQLQVLLGGLSLSRVLQIISRWNKMGWVEYRNPYRDPDKPGSVYATRKAISDLGYEYTYRVRDLESLDHIFAVNKVRLWLEARARERGYKLKWISERELRQLHKWVKYPDGIAIYNGDKVAIEVEISRKAKSSYEAIREFYRGSSYNGYWYFHNGLEGVLREIFGDVFEYRNLNDL